MVEDPEIKAMSAVAAALTDLEDEDARLRVMKWATTRFAPSVRVQTARVDEEDDQLDDGEGGTRETSEFIDFADLFHRSNPKTDPQRALVGGYWEQVVEGKSDFQAMPVNNSLKQLGRPIGNITEAFGALQNRRPSLVRQVQKSGRARQARKKYRLTHEGISTVERMLRGESAG